MLQLCSKTMNGAHLYVRSKKEVHSNCCWLEQHENNIIIVDQAGKLQQSTDFALYQDSLATPTNSNFDAWKQTPGSRFVPRVIHSPRNLFLPVDSAQLAGRKGGGLTNLQQLDWRQPWHVMAIKAIAFTRANSARLCLSFRILQDTMLPKILHAWSFTLLHCSTLLRLGYVCILLEMSWGTQIA